MPRVFRQRPRLWTKLHSGSVAECSTRRCILYLRAFACGLDHGTLAAALRQELLRKSIALAAWIGGMSAALGVACTALWRQGRRYGECTKLECHHYLFPSCRHHFALYLVLATSANRKSTKRELLRRAATGHWRQDAHW